MIFADASALIAIISGEADADQLADRFQQDIDRIFSALSAWETTTGLCRSYGLLVPHARSLVGRYLDAAHCRAVDIGPRECGLAIEAYAHFGKGRHPAALNMGDCFAYACARANGATLLYKGDDFAQTDLA